jgi:type IV pilus assembly protein PilB
MASVKEKIIEALLQCPGVAQADIDAAAMIQEEQGLSFGDAVVKKGIISDKDFLLLLVRELHIPSIDLTRFKIDSGLREIVPEKIAAKYRIIPLSMLGDTMTVALADPLNVFAIDELREMTGKKIDIVLASSSQITQGIRRLYSAQEEGSFADIRKNIDMSSFEVISAQKEEPPPDADAGERAPVIRMVNLVIKEALRQRASDIHIEPTDEDMRVRYRVDGVLVDVLSIPHATQNAVLVRIKIMAKIDITVTQVPQDGRFKMRMGGKEVDFRVSILPTCLGAKVVMRVLDKDKLSVGLAHLGFSADSIRYLDETAAKPFGMILVTGPTGSGKSTTLYSMISKFNTADKNIITIEDPVEYLIDGLTQIETRPEIGLTFAAGLRAVLRQSPDVVMVGEIRDNETADIAVKASLTGQLVLATLHTNDAAGALTRLIDMDVEPFLVASSLIMVCAQRLCRKICPHCKEQQEIARELLAKIGLKAPPGAKFFRGRGCERCRQTGYLGRFGITEILRIDDIIREYLIEGRSSEEIREYAQKEQGMLLLRDDAFSRLLAGETTVEEVLRVVWTE